MATGPKHLRVLYDDKGRETDDVESCRCTIGEDHDDEDNPLSNYLSVDDAALIWLSSGMDEDHTFGYSESEMRRALDRS